MEAAGLAHGWNGRAADPRAPSSALDQLAAEKEARTARARARRRQTPRNGPPNGSGPFALACEFVEKHHTIEGVRALHYWRGEWYAWEGTAWRKLNRDDMRADVYPFLIGRGIEATRSSVDNVMDAMRALAKLSDGTEAPAWLNQETLDPARFIPCANGLLDADTRRLIPPSPDFFNLHALTFDYQPDAKPPGTWLWFLGSIFGVDQESIDVLQEDSGYLLTLDTRQQKAFLIIGPPRSGKGTIARVLRLLVGAANVCAPMLANLGAQFGLQEFIGKQLALISDARLSGRADVDSIVENLLRLSGEDPVTVPRKFLPDYTGVLPVRFLVLTNEVPALADASGALPARFVILRLRTSFLGREDPELLERILPELPGVLLWAIEGLDRLRARGYFIQPGSGESVAADMRALASPLRLFVRDVCTLDADAEVEVRQLYDTWREWSRQQGRESNWTVQMFGSRLASAFPLVHVGRGRRGADGTRPRVYVGIRPRSAADPDPEGND